MLYCRSTAQVRSVTAQVHTTWQHDGTELLVSSSVALQRQTGNGLLRELERVKQECDSSDIDPLPGITIQRRFDSFPASWFFWFYKRWLCWHKSVDNTIKDLEERDERLNEEINKLSKMPDESTGNAVIVFNWVHNAANMLYDHNLRNRCALCFKCIAVLLHAIDVVARLKCRSPNRTHKCSRASPYSFAWHMMGTKNIFPCVLQSVYCTDVCLHLCSTDTAILLTGSAVR